MKKISPKYKRILIKVGSNVVTKTDGTLDSWRISRLVEDISILYRWGVEVILVTSGAVAAGRNDVVSTKNNMIPMRQVWAAIGQVKLMSSYQFLFGKFNIPAGQVLTTKESFRDRLHYLNMKNCISAMLENHVVPIVNENDTIAIDELMFTDNDELSELLASMMNCTAVIILSNVDGIFPGDPSGNGTEIIREVSPGADINKYLHPSRSGYGRGGMITKCSNAKKIASEGTDVYIANGRRDGIITDIIREKDVPFTHFLPSIKKEKSVKKWLSHSGTFAKGYVMINNGAREALTGSRASSLLLIGIVDVEGYFEKGDIVMIIDEKRRHIGLGKAQYDSERTNQMKGLKAAKPFIHCDYMVINGKTDDQA